MNVANGAFAAKLPGIGTHKSRNAIEQCSFPCAGLADEPMHHACLNREVDSSESNGGAESLLDAEELQ